MTTDSLALCKALVERASITPDDAGCQALIALRLAKCGFEISAHPFGDVSNLWARRGTAGPLFTFLGHTDVVPTGPLEQWESNPFIPTEREGYLYGRGAADMKSNIAAMVTAIERFLASYPNHPGSIGLLLTSDEEGASIDGTEKVIAHLEKNGTHIDYCLVGEPSSRERIGDVIKVGRRGSLAAELTIHGKQGHIAYPKLADNAIHRALPALNTLLQEKWDEGNEIFSPTSLQISNIHAGTGANNIIPGILELKCNFRYSPESTAESLQQRFEALLKEHGFRYTIVWHHSGKPFFTQSGKCRKACITAIEKHSHLTPECTTHGGTSDGRFIAPYGTEIIEAGVCNATIHQINECVKISDIDLLSTVYEEILLQLFT